MGHWHVFAAARAAVWVALISGCGAGSPLGGLTTTTPKEEPADYPRAAFGQTEAAFWHPLGAFEQVAWQGIPQAQAGDAMALFDLALAGSGPVLDPARAAAHRGRLTAFLERVRPELEAEKDVWQRGFKLHRAMHAEFLGGADESSDLTGYDFDASDVLGIFERNRYNCISSAILFAVLARALNLQAEGVLIEGHAFVQLTLPDARVVEVETTSRTGFDWVHDAAFYAGRAEGWSAARGLRPNTLADYQARRVVPAHVLVAHNMLNQHTHPGRLPTLDRRRLRELAGALAPQDRDLALARLEVLRDEGIWLGQKQDIASTTRLWDRVRAVVEETGAVFPDDAVVKDALGWCRALQVEAMVSAGRMSDAHAAAERVLAGVYGEQDAKIRDTVIGALANFYSGLSDRAQFGDAEAGYESMGVTCTKTEWCNSFRTHNLVRWGNVEFERKAWDSAITRFEGAVQVGGASSNADVARSNLNAAWHNWVLEHTNAGNWPKAAEVLEGCKVRAPTLTWCAEQLVSLRSEHRM